VRRAAAARRPAGTAAPAPAPDGRRRIAAAVLVLVLATGSAAGAVAAAPAAGSPPRTVVVSIVGTNDVHGHVDRMPELGGYVANLRRARRRDGGAVLLLDGGDMFQGTLESNLGEGAAMVRAFNALGYGAAAVGNHEFDFGPAGPAATPRGPGDDARGALKARAREARFPLLAANVLDAATGHAVSWPHVRPSVVLREAGVKIGVVGVTTTATAHATIAANFRGLQVAPLAETIAAQARALRAAGATVIVVVAHAGGACRAFDDPAALDSCEAQSEIFQVARALPPGTVDVIVAGHTHDGLAHSVAGAAIIEAYAEGRYFGRVDLTIDRATGRPVGVRIWPPHPVCTDAAACAAERYEGAPVVPDAAVARAISGDLARARSLRAQPLGVIVTATVRRAHRQESALGNLFADLMRQARPDADVTLVNGGGLRADLPPGPLTYGELFEANPFDNRFATLRLTGEELAAVVAGNLGRDNGIISVSGARVAAACGPDGALHVVLTRDRGGQPIAPGDALTIVTSDFLATGGDGLFSPEIQRRAVLDTGPPIRDAMAAALRQRGGTLDGDAPPLSDAAHPRLTYPPPRPVRCAAAARDARAPD
jgi:5'-nucleotidase